MATSDLIWILLAFGLAICWAAITIVNKQTLEMVTPLGINFIVRGITCVSVLVLAGMLTVTHAWPYGFGLTWEAFGWVAFNSLITWVIAFSAYYYALRGGSVGVVIPIVSTDPLWTAVLAAVLLGVALSMPTIVGLVITLVGVALIARWSGGDVPEGSPDVLPGAPPAGGRRRAALVVIALATITAIGWGASPVIVELAYDANSVHGGPSDSMMVLSQALGMLFIGLIMLARRARFLRRPLRPGERRRLAVLLVTTGLLEAVFAVTYYVALDHLGAVILTLTIASSPVFSVIAGYVFLRERIGLKLAVGAAVTLVGVLIVTVAALT